MTKIQRLKERLILNCKNRGLDRKEVLRAIRVLRERKDPDLLRLGI